MEAAGAVFLPAAGFRWGTSIHFMGDNGFYWSSNSIPYSVDHAYNVSFGDGDLTTTGSEDINSGQAVRLVRNSN